MSEILITGGNGFVGRNMVAALQTRGYTVRVLVTPPEDASWLSRRGVAVHRGDVRRAETLRTPMRGTESVLHLAAMQDVWRGIEDYRAVNVTGTENVCRAALAAGVRRIVHMSSSSVYGVALGQPADESFPLVPFPDPYPITKAAADVAVRRLIDHAQLPAVIVRPDQIFGPGDHLHFGRMADRLRAGRTILVGGGDNALPLVYITDLVRGLVLALEHERAVGQAYNITNDRPLTQRQLLDAIAHEIDVPSPRVHVPYRALYAAGYLAERLGAVMPRSRRPPITRLGVAFYGTENRCAIGKARRELGYEPEVGLLEGVRRTASWYLQAEPSHPSAAISVPGPVADRVSA